MGEKEPKAVDAAGGPAPGFFSAIGNSDERAFFFVFRKTRNPVFDVVMPMLSAAANRGVGIILLGAALIAVGGKMRGAGVAMLACAGAAGLFTELVAKKAWFRARPFMAIPGVKPRISHERLRRRSSFPSGHSAGYFAGAVSLSIYMGDARLAVVFCAVAALGAYSRVYNGVHYPSDVIAGSASGIIFALSIMHFLMPVVSGL